MPFELGLSKSADGIPDVAVVFLENTAAAGSERA